MNIVNLRKGKTNLVLLVKVKINVAIKSGYRTKTKVITPANHKRQRQSCEPIQT